MRTVSIKREFSTAFLEQLEPILEEYRAYYTLEKAEDEMLRICDSAEGSSYYFSIHKESWTAQGNEIQYSRKPWSTHDATAKSSSTWLANFRKNLEDWFKLVQRHQERSILEDPILWGYEQEYSQEFRLADEDADTAPFGYAQQLFLDSYIEAASNGLDSLRNEDNEALISELKEEAATIRQAITKETKNRVMGRLYRWWAKGRKSGLKLSNWMITKFAEGLVKETAGVFFKWAVRQTDGVPSIVDSLKHFLISSHGS